MHGNTKLQDELFALARDQHAKYCARLEEYAKGFPQARDRMERRRDLGLHVWPECEFSILLKPRVAGIYYTGTHTCTYSTPYMIVTTTQYEPTVAHECCHAFARFVWPGAKWHGEFFMHLLRHVCGFEHEKARHSYDFKTAAKVQQLLWLEQKVREAQQ